MMNSWHSYPSIYNLGHRAIKDLFSVPVIIEEKVDGSQFSFGIDEDGEIHVRSKGAVMVLDAPEKMFTKAVETVKRLAPVLHPGWTYRGEYLAKVKHNVLAYDRVPEGNIIIFDINTDEENYLPYLDKRQEAVRLGLEVVPLLATGTFTSAAELREFLQTPSSLGGQLIEGMVIKPQEYNLYGLDKKVLMGKFVSEAFKEIHAGEWKKENPTAVDVVDGLIAELKTPARWNKGVQHLRESGLIEDSPRDIGKIMKEVQADVKKECEELIKERLFAHVWPRLNRAVVAGLPEWYKDELLKKQFEATAE